ncbi:MAG: hypothetical protein JNM78_19910 [Cyclobacteriaceae bacterium]|nr:hypothetical protein [Cyclobacteriaceae bacterium]
MTTETSKNTKVVAGVAITILLASLVGIIMLYNSNGELRGNLNAEKLKGESILSQKLTLEKDIAKFKSQIESMKGTNSELDKELARTSARLAAKEAEFKKVQNESLSLKQLKKQHNELLGLQKEWENSMAAMKGKLQSLENEKNDLSKAIASLEERNKILSEDLHKSQLAFLDYSQLETLKKNDRLTASARNTKKLKATFEVPSNLKEISFKITDPSGKVLTEKEGTIASRIVADSKSYTASVASYAETSKNLKHMEMVYLTNKKLKPGTYKIEVLSENLYVSSLQVRLK